MRPLRRGLACLAATCASTPEESCQYALLAGVLVSFCMVALHWVQARHGLLAVQSALQGALVAYRRSPFPAPLTCARVCARRPVVRLLR